MTRATSRGVRNNNPGNIERTATKWQGMAPDQSGDPRFAVFRTPQFGIRAMGVTLLTYEHKYAIQTIRKAVDRWAPPKENDTDAYIQAVAQEAGVGPDDVVDFDDIRIMRAIVKAIIHHENGAQPYSDAVIEEGLHLAGIAGAKPAPLVKSKPFIAQAASGVAVAGALCSQASGPLKAAADQLTPFVGAPVVSHLQTIILTVAGLCVMAGLVAAWAKHRAG